MHNELWGCVEIFYFDYHQYTLIVAILLRIFNIVVSVSTENAIRQWHLSVMRICHSICFSLIR